MVSSPMQSDENAVEKILKILRTMRAAAYQCDKERLVKVERFIKDQQQDIDDLRKQRKQYEQVANSLQSQLLAHGIQPQSLSTRSRSRSRGRGRGPRGSHSNSRNRSGGSRNRSSSYRNRSGSNNRGRSGSRGQRRGSNGDTRHVRFANQTSSSPPPTPPPPPQAANIGRERQPRHYHMSKEDLCGHNRSRSDEFGATRDRLADRFDLRPGMPPFPGGAPPWAMGGGSPPMPPMPPMHSMSMPPMPMPMPPMPIPGAIIHPPIGDPIGMTPMMFSAAWGEDFIHGGGPFM